MKKLILLTLCMLLIGAGAAMADTIVNFSNNTTVTDNNSTNYLYPSVIGSSNWFATSGGSFDLTTGMLTIDTNWNPGKDGTFSGGTNANVNTAWLFIYLGTDTTPDYAINLDYGKTTGAGTFTATVYKTPGGIQTSYNYFGTSGLTYGKYIGGTQVDVTASSGASTSTTNVIWTYGSGNLNNTVEVNLAGLLTSGPWTFLWGTADCANGPIVESFQSGVPLPPSAILFGTGLLGLVGLGWRRRKIA